MIYIPPLEKEVDSKTKVFEDGGVQDINRTKINRTAIKNNNSFLVTSLLVCDSLMWLILNSLFVGPPRIECAHGLFGQQLFDYFRALLFG